MKTLEVVGKLEGLLTSISEIVNIGFNIFTGVGATITLITALVDRFKKEDPLKEWTQEEINAEADAVIAGIKERDKDFVKDEPDDESDDDGSDA